MITHIEFKNAMESLAKIYDDDTEQVHRAMDRLMADVLTDLGYRDGIKIFESTDKWYA